MVSRKYATSVTSRDTLRASVSLVAMEEAVVTG